MCHGRVVETCRKGPPTMGIAMIGLDIAKSVLQIHAVNEVGLRLRHGIDAEFLRSTFRISCGEAKSLHESFQQACGNFHAVGVMPGDGNIVRRPKHPPYGGDGVAECGLGFIVPSGWMRVKSLPIPTPFSRPIVTPHWRLPGAYPRHA